MSGIVKANSGWQRIPKYKTQKQGQNTVASVKNKKKDDKLFSDIVPLCMAGVQIQLSPKWRLMSSERQWILAERASKSDTTKYKNKYFFTDLNHLFELFVEIRLRRSETIGNLQTLIDQQKKIATEITKTISESLKEGRE